MIEIPKLVGLDNTPMLDIEEMLKKCFVDVNAILKPQPIALSIGTTEYKGNRIPIPYGSYGGFSCIVGASKSKKTFLKSLLVACYIGGDAHRYAKKITPHNATGKFVIEFDTEQSQWYCQKTYKRVIEMCGKSPDIYKPFSLLEYSYKERLQFIEYILLESEYRSNIGLVTIDGVADLVPHANDEVSSYDVANKIVKWASITNSHIITILHRNFGSDKPTGHLGSAVLKKAELVTFLEAEDRNVIVSPEYTRGISFDKFIFGIDDSTWLPYLIEDNFNVKTYSESINNRPF